MSGLTLQQRSHSAGNARLGCPILQLLDELSTPQTVCPVDFMCEKLARESHREDKEHDQGPKDIRDICAHLAMMHAGKEPRSCGEMRR